MTIKRLEKENKMKKTMKISALFMVAMTLLMVNCAKSDDALAAAAASTSACSSTTLSTTVTNPTALETALCTGGTLTTVANGGTITAGTKTGCVSVDANATVTMTGVVKFGEGSIFRVNSGATIKGDASTLSYLIIDRGAAIKAVGTAAAPITFTSSNTAGTRVSGDWGGLVINGRAKINAGCGEANGEGDSGNYGGNADTDNSGTLQYVRVQFGGKIFSGTNELNGIAFQGVGSGTTVDHIHVHKGKDDGIEFFGGTVNAKYIVSTSNEDDQIDWTNGYTGKLQFIVAAPVGTGTDTGFEMDNNETSFSASPVANPTLYNVTVVKGNDGNLGKRGMRFRRGTKAKLRNAYIANKVGTVAWSNNQCITLEDAETSIDVDASVLIEHCGTTGYTVTAGTLTGSGNLVVQNAPATPWLDLSTGTPLDTQAFLNTNNGAAFVKVAAPSSTPTAVDPTLEGGTFFSAGTFVGAINNGANWQTTGGTWVAYPPN